MRFVRSRFGSKLAMVGVAALVLAACGKSSSPTSSAGASQGGSRLIGVATVGSIGKVLDNSQGLTLYHLTSESNGKIACTGPCATTWPPMLVTGAVPAAPAGVSGTLGTVKRPDGTTQLTFDGMPLYTYSGDSGPGQANGQGIQGVWFAVSPTGSSSGGTSGGTSGGGGYGGGGGY